jgi:hypothetical protein
MYMGICPFSAWIRYGFWWLGMVSNGSLSVQMFLVHLRWFRNYTFEMEMERQREREMKWVGNHDCRT